MKLLKYKMPKVTFSVYEKEGVLVLWGMQIAIVDLDFIIRLFWAVL